MSTISASNEKKQVKPVSSRAKIIGATVNVISTTVFAVTLAAIVAFIFLLDHNPDVLYKLTVDYYINELNFSAGDASFLLFPRDFYLKFDWLVILGCIVSGITALVSFIFMMRASAHTGDGELKPNKFDRIPFEIALAILIAIALIFGIATALSISYLEDGGTYERYTYYSEYYKAEIDGHQYIPPTYGVRIGGAVLMLDILAAFSLSISFFYTLAARIKTHTLIKNTVVYRILRLIFRIVRWIFKNTVVRFFRAIRFVIKNLSATWYYALALIGYLLVNFFPFIIILNLGYIDIYCLALFALIFVFDAASLYFVIRTASAFNLIDQSAKRMAKGELRYKIATQSIRGPLKSHAESLNSISDGLALAVEQQMKSERFKTELITNVSHDIKTPVTSIINYVGLAKAEHTDNEKLSEYIDVIDRQSQRLKKLTEDILEASKASSGVISANVVKTNVSELLKQCAGEYSERMESAGLDLVLDVPDEIYAMCDGRLMWRVFDNLLSNAYKYSLPGTRVYITADAERGGYIPISVKNISKNRLNIPGEALMERFVRGDISRHSEGSGLGLSISKSLTDLQKGKLSITIDGDFFKAELLLPIE